ncbi:MAG: MTH1187 family thiamine-binding protein [Candidatus Njordarchaeales archaeon]
MARIIAEFSLVPVGTQSTSLSKYVAEVLRALQEAGVKYHLTPMCTIIEGDSLDEIFEAIKIAHEAIVKTGVKRIVLRINIDDRLDKLDRRAEDKVKSVKEKLR